MFQRTRITLTLWYTIVLIFVCFFFSFFIYNLISTEIERMAQKQQMRFNRRIIIGNGVIIDKTEKINPPQQFLPQIRPEDISIDSELVELVHESKSRLIFTLICINSFILLIFGYFSYILSGKTLKPIKEMLDEQNRFITDASHEFRTPLTSLKTVMEVFLRDKNVDIEEAKDIVRESINDVNKLQSLSDNLLELAQHKTQKIPMTDVNIQDCINSAIRNVLALAKSKNILIEKDISDIVFFGNMEKITDMLIIFLDNAIKYSYENTKIKIITNITNENIIIIIKDHGIGINKDDVNLIFDRFYRADKARTHSENAGGYGLGLSIAKNIIKMHNGSISIESTIGEGTNFSISIPLKFKNNSFFERIVLFYHSKIQI